MILSLRQAIIQRVHDKSAEELIDVINDSIGGDDKALPGLGVLFELIWEHSGHEEQISMAATLKSHLDSGAK
ncbi:small acid-soluble spore protein SspI [Paenibacillus hemerocallicola]|jgi:small acid-soluble spore protein I (minor)|uniref:Small, acid-soluble spore protein I n=1 Tax=Paenibacillus hemerocallicola TaxID=1172614 RepID=A0A5C4T6B3_9BACL|nr:small acid-soluble spore protein SspI [Paenibacillus hemerocallicola]TNJ64598.1 small acid-soluble spore protein SspI [Paenibacillus hemerocallicola]